MLNFDFPKLNLYCFDHHHPAFMKKLSVILFLILAAYQAKSQTLVLAKDAKQYLGKTVTICDSVYSTKALEKINLINLGGAFPKELLTIVINKEDLAKFSAEPASMFLGNNICVTGIVTEFKGKTQIVVTDPKQIVVK
jgi:DNA/RNA endonuclease YhcR with UshA esterase domain